MPGKNLRPLAGRSLLARAINSAQSAATVDRVVVVTEDDDIAAHAEIEGADVMRSPQHLASDDSPSFPVISWATSELSRLASSEVFAALRATSPFRASEDIDNAVRMLNANGWADSVVSVTEAIGVHPTRLKRVLDDGRLVDAFEEEGPYPVPRQRLDTLYVRNGAVYVVRADVVAKGSLWGDSPLAYLMPEERSLNINTEFQFLVADLIAHCDLDAIVPSPPVLEPRPD